MSARFVEVEKWTEGLYLFRKDAYMLWWPDRSVFQLIDDFTRLYNIQKTANLDINCKNNSYIQYIQVYVLNMKLDILMHTIFIYPWACRTIELLN